MALTRKELEGLALHLALTIRGVVWAMDNEKDPDEAVKQMRVICYCLKDDIDRCIDAGLIGALPEPPKRVRKKQ
jgi:hypothetical protein